MSEMGNGNPGSQVSRESGETYLTLAPLRTDGPDALDPAGIPEISNARLCLVEVTGDNPFHEIFIHGADDLFRSAAADGPLSNPIPSTGTITAAVFSIEFADSPQPRQVTVRLPDTVLLERPSDAPAIFRWLAKNRFRLQRKLAQILLLLSLSLVAAAASPLIDDDSDDDDDDDDPDRPALAFGT